MNNFKTRLNAVKKRKRFIFRGESRSLAGELEELLEMLRAESAEPRSVLEGLAFFYKSDKFIFERCDDSNGSVGDVYRYTAVDMFVTYAKKCEDKKWIADLIFKLYSEDDYGVRFCLLERMSEFVPEPLLRKTVEKFWALSNTEDDSPYGSSHVSSAIETLAEQLNDPALLERACKTFARKDAPSTASLLQMAALHLKCGNVAEALEWIQHVPLTEKFMAEERDELLVNIHKALGNEDAVRETAWRIFRSCRSPENFERIISIVGEPKRSEIVDSESALILATEKLSYGDVAFLIETGRIDAAETYMIQHSSQFHGGYDYDHLLHFAKIFQKHNRLIVATLIYRALLESILARAKSKIYHHGINYLRKLDSLSDKISDWKDIENHAQYKARIKEANKLKYSFWSEYGS